MVIRWIVHLKNGQTVVDDQGPEVHEIDPDKISSIESISPTGKKVIIHGNPFLTAFSTLVTASDLLNPLSGQSEHQELERTVNFVLFDSTIEVTIDCLTDNVHVRVKRKE